MAYVMVPPGKNVATLGIKEGECRIDRGGTVTFRAADLEAVGIKHFAISLADPENMRLAFRSVRDGEQMNSIAVQAVMSAKKLPTDRRRIRAIRALQVVGVDGKAVAGGYKVHRHDDRIEVNLTEARAADLPAVKRPEFTTFERKVAEPR